MTLVSPWQKGSIRTSSKHFRDLTKLITIDNHFEHLRNGYTTFNR